MDWDSPIPLPLNPTPELVQYIKDDFQEKVECFMRWNLRTSDDRTPHFNFIRRKDRV